MMINKGRKNNGDVGEGVGWAKSLLSSLLYHYIFYILRPGLYNQIIVGGVLLYVAGSGRGRR